MSDHISVTQIKYIFDIDSSRTFLGTQKLKIDLIRKAYAYIHIIERNRCPRTIYWVHFEKYSETNQSGRSIKSFWQTNEEKENTIKNLSFF